MTSNPYQAPRAEVTDYQPEDADAAGFAGDPQGMPAGRGLDWFKEGWALFAQSPALWIGIYLVFIGIMVFSALIPLIGSIGQSLLYPMLGAGMAVGCDALRRGQPLEFAHLFAGFSRNAGQLLLLGALYLVGALVTAMIALVPTIGLVGGMAAMGVGEPEAFLASIGLPLAIGILIWIALLLPVMMGIWFAPALIILNDLPAVDAIKASFRGCLRNIVPFLVYSLVGLLLAVLATLPLGLGWLVLAPVLITSTYAAYRDIFYRH